KADLEPDQAVRPPPGAQRPAAEPGLNRKLLQMAGEVGGVLAPERARPPEQPRIRVGVGARHAAEFGRLLDDDRPEPVIVQPERAGHTRRPAADDRHPWRLRHRQSGRSAPSPVRLRAAPWFARVGRPASRQSAVPAVRRGKRGNLTSPAPLLREHRMVSLQSESDLKDAIRTIPDYPKPGIMFRDITTLLGDARAFRRAVDELVQPWAGMKVDKVAGIEARGFILGGAVAHQVSAGF